MTEILSYNQQTDILENAVDHFKNADLDIEELEDAVWVIVDSWLPVYNNHILNDWQLAGCPEPEEIMTLATAENIFKAMQGGLWETANDYLHSVLAKADGITEALEICEKELEARQ
jgi:hypothetical protein